LLSIFTTGRCATPGSRSSGKAWEDPMKTIGIAREAVRSGDAIPVVASRRPSPRGIRTGIVLGVLSLATAGQAQNQLALTPPMAWNSWNCFYGDINETKIKSIADAMASKGMRDAGYVYLNLDDNWMANPARDASGNLRADPTRFPGGIKALSDYVHAKGLKLGIYGDRGSMTCMNVPQSGGYGNEERDAKTYASWGVDYLKYDNCNPKGVIKDDYVKMGNALANSGRPIVYSVCAWHTEEWMPQVGNLWRSTDDITTDWLGSSNSLGRAIMVNLDGNAGNFIFTRPGSWSDPDMLEVGNGNRTDAENRSHFGLWALMAAPLVTGNDLRSMSSSVQAILTHSEVIAIDQDSAGIQGRRILKNGDLETWAKPLGTGFETYAVGLFNRSGAATNMTIRWSDLQLDPSSVSVRDVWAKKDLGTMKDSYTVSVPSRGLALLKVQGKLDPTATLWLSDRHIHSVTNAWKFLGVDKSVAGNALKIGTKSYAKGLGAHAPSTTVLSLRRKFDSFQADLGIDAEVTGGSVVYQVFGDGKKLYESPVCKGGAAPLAIDIPVKGVDSLSLVVADAGDGNTNDHADWGGAKLLAAVPTGIATRQPARSDWQAKVVGDRLLLDRSTEGAETIRLLDLQGRVLLTRRAQGLHVEIPTATLSRGLYSVQTGSGSSAWTKTVIVD